MLTYSQNSATLDEITSFLLRNSSRFYPPLDKRNNISAYFKKLKQYAHLFEARDNTLLVSVIAVYLNQPTNKVAYITLTCCDKNYSRQGITSTLHRQLEKTAREFKFTTLRLEASITNLPAQKLYKKLGYVFLSQNNEKIQFIKML